MMARSMEEGAGAAPFYIDRYGRFRRSMENATAECSPVKRDAAVAEQLRRTDPSWRSGCVCTSVAAPHYRDCRHHHHTRRNLVFPTIIVLAL